jgi:hypothetical protein
VAKNRRREKSIAIVERAGACSDDTKGWAEFTGASDSGRAFAYRAGIHPHDRSDTDAHIIHAEFGGELFCAGHGWQSIRRCTTGEFGFRDWCGTENSRRN